MKKIMYPLLAVSLAYCMPFKANSASTESDSLGLPGDNFDLYGALEVFKNAKTLEDFEKELNSEKNGINNLDLNADGETDYIRIVDHMDGDAHAITIEVPVSENETQTIAVIEVEKNGEDNVGLQLIGDEDMYGENYIIEPYEESEENATEMPVAAPRIRIVVNVWPWRPIRFIYGPRYTLWASPYRWGRYPRWYRPWRPVAWRTHRARCNRYRVYHVHRVHVHRNVRAHKVYHTHRVRSTTVHRNQANHVSHSHKTTAVPKKTSTKQRSSGGAHHKTGTSRAQGKSSVPSKRSGKTAKATGVKPKTKTNSKAGSRSSGRSSGVSRSKGGRR